MAERRSFKIFHREEAHEARHCAYKSDNVPVQGITVELHNSVNVDSLKRPAFQDREVLTMDRAVIRGMELTTKPFVFAVIFCVKTTETAID